jgi:ketosteroid isomerase-like protein
MRLLWPVVCVVLLGAAPRAAAAQLASRQEVEGRVAELLAAFRRNDPRGVAQMFADDASILGPGVRVVARAAIDSYWVARPRPTSWDIETLEVGGSRDQPWQHARSIRVNRTAAKADTSYTTFILVWKRGPDGKLRIYLDLYT